jgi:anti-sigma factor RsiW
MMECKDVLALISPYIDNELDASKRAAVEEHLPVCDSCKAQLKKIESVVSALESLDELEVPPEISHALYNIASAKKVKEKKVFTAWSSFSFIKYFAATAAVAAIAITVLISQSSKNANELAFHGEISQKAINADSSSSSSINSAKDAIGENGVIKNKSTGKPGADETKTKSLQDNASRQIPATGLATAPGNQTFGSSADLATTPSPDSWPKVIISETNYDRTSSELLLGKIAKETSNLYTVNDATQRRAETIEQAVEKINSRNENGEAMRKPIEALLNETKRDALPVYMEKARFKGSDCWIIIMRWGFGNKGNELNRASLYVTDLSGWKTLHFQSQN